MEFIKAAARAADDRKASGIIILDVKEICDFTEYFLICSGDNLPQVRAIAEAIKVDGKILGRSFDHLEGKGDSGWILMDYGSEVIHIFLDEIREFYGLELLWGDAPQVAWK